MISEPTLKASKDILKIRKLCLDVSKNSEDQYTNFLELKRQSEDQKTDLKACKIAEDYQSISFGTKQHSEDQGTAFESQ